MARSNLLFGSVVAMATVLASSAAQAQTTAPADDNAIGDIIVTAQRRAEPIQSVPVAVTALSAAELDNPTLRDIRDISGRVPSLVVDPVTAGPGAAAISIRGISFEDIEKSFDPAVGVSVDGVFVGTNTGQLLDAFDLASLEVLRGPQGTLFGRNTIGGVISVARTKPTGEFGVKASFAYSSFNTKSGKLVVNLPSFGDLVALKGFFYYDDTEGFFNNVMLNRKAGKYETITAGATAKITPSSNIEAILTYEHMRERGETVSTSLSVTGKDLLCAGIFGTPADQCNRIGLPFRGQYTVFQNQPTPVTNDTDAVTGNINVDLGGSFSLTSVTGYRRNNERVIQDFDGTSVPFFLTDRSQVFRQFSQELRVVGDITPWLNLLVGGFYYDSRYQLTQGTTSVLFGGATLFQSVDHKAKSYAGFADAKIKPTDSLTIGVGGRYTRDEKSIFNTYGGSPVPNGLCPAVIPDSACRGAEDFGKFTWRASADYKIGAGQLIYGSYSKGFRSGGFNGRASAPSSLGPYQPETVNAYEVGLKADWLRKTLRTNIAVYQTDYTNKQEETVQPCSGPLCATGQETVVQNAASARIRGFEAEITAVPDRHLTFHASLAYIDAKYLNFFRDVNGDTIPDDVSTLTLRRAPKWSWSTGLDYSREVGSGKIDASASFRFVDKYTTCIVADTPAVLGNVVNDTRCTAEPREILDASIGYTFDLGGTQARLTLFGRNLTNNRGLASTLPVAGLFTFGNARAPRRLGGEIQIKF